MYYEFKNLNEVEHLEAPTENTTVMGFEGGMPVQIPAERVGKRRELVYEFTPGIDADGNPVTDVYGFMQNVDEDLSWLTEKQDDIGWEIVVTGYGLDGNNGDSDYVVITDMEVIGIARDDDVYTGYTRNVPNVSSTMSTYIEAGGWDVNGLYNYCSGEAIAVNGIHFDTDGNASLVERGGSIGYDTDTNPLKSIRIYKIYR